MRFPIGKALALALLATAAGCAQDLSAHVRVGPRPPNPDSATPVYVDRGTTTPPAGYTIDRFRMVIRNVRFQSRPTESGEQTPDMRMLVPGPTLVDLSGAALVPGTFSQLLEDYGIGARSFYELDVDLAPVTAAEAAADATLAPLVGQTFLIEGRLPGGTAFTFGSALTQQLIRPFVYRMGMNHNNLDLNIWTDLWFIGPGGVALDPTSADPQVHTWIEENVAGSIDAFEDDNFDGVPDPLA